MIKSFPVNTVLINNLGKVSRKVVALGAADIPTNLALAIIDDNTLRLTWDDNSTIEDGYSIERSVAGGAYAEIDTVAASVETYDDDTCEPDILYAYRVRGYKGAVYTVYSNVASETIDEPQYRIFESETGVFWRRGIRSGYIVLDVALTPTGFTGAENTDWKNVDKTLIEGGSADLYVELEFDLLANASGMIDGDATSLDDWNTAFNLPTNGTPFTSITIDGNTVTLRGGSNITVPDSLFSTDWDGYGHLVSIVDTGCIVAAGYNSFGDYDEDSNGTILETAILPALVTAGDGCFYYSESVLVNIDFSSLTTAGIECFSYQYALVNPVFLSLTTAGRMCFNGCRSLVNPNFSALITADNQCFQGCTSFITMNFPVLTSLGTTVGDDYVFADIKGKTITLTIPAALMTCNAGQPDGDIQYLTDPAQGNTVTIIQV